MVHTLLRCLVLTLALSPVWAAQQSPDVVRQVLSIPRLDRPLTLEDFLEMKPAAGLAGRVAKVEGFTQRMPKDGEPATQRTEAYMAYDEKNLYTVFVCFDSEPDKVRANLSRRENVFSDDWVELTVDTFHDQRRGYVFL